jgi:hypothetical protein
MHCSQWMFLKFESKVSDILFIQAITNSFEFSIGTKSEDINIFNINFSTICAYGMEEALAPIALIVDRHMPHIPLHIFGHS